MTTQPLSKCCGAEILPKTTPRLPQSWWHECDKCRNHCDPKTGSITAEVTGSSPAVSINPTVEQELRELFDAFGGDDLALFKEVETFIHAYGQLCREEGRREQIRTDQRICEIIAKKYPQDVSHVAITCGHVIMQQKDVPDLADKLSN